MLFLFVSASSKTYFGGRFSHVSAVAYGDILLFVGGYRGNVLGDAIAFKVPLPIAKNKVNTSSSRQFYLTRAG